MMNDFSLSIAVAWYVVFVFSVTLHEAAHAYVAKILGDPTAYYGGQVTIDPIPHMKREPFGMILLPIITVIATGWPIGFAHAPYDPYWAYNHPKRAAWMAFAGPASNLIVAIISMIIIAFTVKAGIFVGGGVVEHLIVHPNGGILGGAAMILSMLFFMNVVLAVLNIIPLPPLDGSSVISLFMKDSTARSYLEFVRQPTYSMIGMILVWQFFHHVFYPVFGFFIGVINAIIN